MPHCVLTLRLIGLCLDYYDGRKKPDQLNAHQKKMALVQAPTLLEMCGHVYFPGGFLVGPQFSMRRYLDFTNRVYEKVEFSIQKEKKKYLTSRLVFRKVATLCSALSPVLFVLA
jgi:lysophospholipid acyltransferase 5